MQRISIKSRQQKSKCTTPIVSDVQTVLVARNRKRARGGKTARASFPDLGDLLQEVFVLERPPLFWVEVLTKPPDMPGVVIALFSGDEQLLGGSCEQF